MPLGALQYMQQPQNTGFWQSIQNSLSNPHNNQALLNFGLGMLRDRQPGQSSMDMFANSMTDSMEYLRKLKEAEARNKMMQDSFNLKEREVTNKEKATNESIASSEQNRRQSADIHPHKVEAARTSNEIAVDKNDRDERYINAKIELMKREMEQVGANAGMPSAGVQEVSLLAEQLMKADASLPYHQAMINAFDRLKTKNPEFYNPDAFKKSMMQNISANTAVLGEDMEDASLSFTNKLTNEAFRPPTQPMPFTPQGMIDKASMRPGVVYESYNPQQPNVRHWVLNEQGNVVPYQGN